MSSDEKPHRDPSSVGPSAGTLDVTPSATMGTLSEGLDEPPEAWIGRTVDRKYEIESILGVGGMGMVFRANRVLVGDAIALKVLFPRCMSSELQRRLFRDEAIAAARLNHRNVVTVFDAEMSVEDNSAYIAMELLNGESFKNVLKAHAPMDPTMLLPLMIQVCDGLSAAHQARIIHRDLKPDNIFLEHRKDGSTRVKLVDFGIASMVDVSYGEQPRRLLGTLRYMAPEQARGEPVDPRADLYALGVVMYESLTRRRVTGKTVTEVLKQPPTPPSEFMPPDQQLPRALETLLMSMLQKTPEARPDSARVVRDRLQSVMDDLTGALPEPTPAPMTRHQPAPPPVAPVEPKSKATLIAAISVGVAVLVALAVLLK